MEMLLTGEFDRRARRRSTWGLVNRVVPLGDLDAAIAQITGDHPDQERERRARSASAPSTSRSIAGCPSAYALTGDVMACNLLDPDAAEGIDAFVAKRQPRWNLAVRR